MSNDLFMLYGPRMIQSLLALGVCSIRLYVIMTLFPPTADGILQGPLRNGVALIFSLYIAIAQPASFVDSLNASTLIVAGLREALIGTVLGFGAATVFWVAESAGTYLDSLSGYNNAQITNPMRSEKSTPSGTLMSQLAIVAFWTLGGMEFLLQALYDSYKWWPVASSRPIDTNFLEMFVLSQTDTMMQMIAKLAAPLLFVMVLVDLGVNLASKSAQKLELGALSQPIKGVVAVLMLALFAGIFVNEVRDQLDLRLFAQQMHGLATSGIGAAKP
ncbi:type III secretion system export apparatus subunit SctT [Caballeronia mineralivorans]|jgi:type III secretion protein T|uniref:type III secretion system export apparatus subunit SctT n=1 Tax=Caballeronia mineralivorans TaxID=2010198 RepID=UPI0023F045CF|nr:type III secretion system export apparatus subunit SctT [Caballeronia mineralivorans]MDB5787000.1 Flagellar biosynthesis protein FliR [Caballeronia mineralivorans]MEA3098933.1 type secretion protein [Caballeronia mineralivorans]